MTYEEAKDILRVYCNNVYIFNNDVLITRVLSPAEIPEYGTKNQKKGNP